jgi:hypothetical protein
MTKKIRARSRFYFGDKKVLEKREKNVQTFRLQKNANFFRPQKEPKKVYFRIAKSKLTPKKEGGHSGCILIVSKVSILIYLYKSHMLLLPPYLLTSISRTSWDHIFLARSRGFHAQKFTDFLSPRSFCVTLSIQAERHPRLSYLVY